MKLGLDELIIVNPGGPPSETSWVLGADGGVYRIDSAAGDAIDSPATPLGLGQTAPVPRYFLGDDGVLYETR